MTISVTTDYTYIEPEFPALYVYNKEHIIAVLTSKTHGVILNPGLSNFTIGSYEELGYRCAHFEEWELLPKKFSVTITQ